MLASILLELLDCASEEEDENFKVWSQVDSKAPWYAHLWSELGMFFGYIKRRGGL